MSLQKKICSVTTIADSTENFVLDSLIELQRRGWDVTIICNMTEKLRRKIPSGIAYYDVPMERSYSLKVAIESFFKLLKIFRKERFSIVQYGTTHAALFSSVASKIARIPVRMHLQWGIYNFSEMGWKGKFFKFTEWLTCKCSTDIRPVSLKNLQVAVDEGLMKRDKAKVLGEGGTIGVRIEDYPMDKKMHWRSQVRKEFGINDKTYVFGFLGRISRDKGNNELLSAFKRIVDSDSETYVALMLMGPNENTINPELCKWAKESPNVIFTGPVTHEEVPKYLSAINVLVHPTYREGFGMVLQEAMAMEVGIITTDIPGPSEVIENGKSGVCIAPKNTEELYRTMMNFCKHPDIADKYGIEGRKRVIEHFNRLVMVENICIDKEELICRK